MSFYENYVRLCNMRGQSPSGAALSMGIEKSSVSRWARGSLPRYATLVKLSEYFGVQVSELLGDDKAEDDGKNATAVEKVDDEDNALAAALEALRNQPGRRALLSATKNMTEAQVLRFADWLADITGGDKD